APARRGHLHGPHRRPGGADHDPRRTQRPGVQGGVGGRRHAVDARAGHLRRLPRPADRLRAVRPRPCPPPAAVRQGPGKAHCRVTEAAPDLAPRFMTDRRTGPAWRPWDWGSAAFNAVLVTFIFSVSLTDSVRRNVSGPLTPAQYYGFAIGLA